MSDFIRARSESDVKVEKPFENCDERHMSIRMTDMSKSRFEGGRLGMMGDIQLKGNLKHHICESTDNFWRLTLFRYEKVDSENLFSFT